MKTNSLLQLVCLLAILCLNTSCENLASELFGSNEVTSNNTVEIPTEKDVPTIIQMVLQDQGFGTLASMIKENDFAQTLDEKGPYTIFAPVNFAFEKLPDDSYKKMSTSENEEYISKLLSYHIIPSEINEADIKQAIDDYGGSVPLKTLGGKRLTASLKQGRIFLIDEQGNGGNLITTDVKASNGMMHTIDVVLRPNIK